MNRAERNGARSIRFWICIVSICILFLPIKSVYADETPEVYRIDENGITFDSIDYFGRAEAAIASDPLEDFSRTEDACGRESHSEESAVLINDQSQDLKKAPIPEKLYTNNHWNVLTLIYQDCKTAEYENSFTDEEVAFIKSQMEKLPDIYKRLSEGRLIIDVMDFKVMNQPLTSVSAKSESSGMRYTTFGGKDKDVYLDPYLKGNDYQMVFIYWPGKSFPDKGNWYGMGGTDYDYKNKYVQVCQINDTPWAGAESCEIYGQTYDTRLGVAVHEMLHNIENNSRRNKIDDFQILHSGADNGYEENYDRQWFDWYHDLMTDQLKNGKKGFSKDSFIVLHGTVSEKKLNKYKPKLKSVTAKKRKITIKVKNWLQYPFRYQLQVKKEGGDWQHVTFDIYTSKYTTKKMEKGTYQVRVRAFYYKEKTSEWVYGKWSKAKKVQVK